MGARRDFIQAMLLGVVVGIAITVAFFQLRGKADISAAPKPTAAPDDRDQRIEEKLRRLELERKQLVEHLARQGSGRRMVSDHGGGYRPPDADHGMSTSDDWWAKLPPNPAWDEPREAKVLERLAKLGVKVDASQVECKRRCCRIVLDEETYDEQLDAISSSVGLDFEPPDGMGTSNIGNAYMVTKCWRPTDKPLPDRAVERDALLAKAKPELDRCAQSTSPAITLQLVLHVDQDGQIEKVDSNAKQLGQKAASCAETAVLQVASFTASPMDTEVPLTIVLGK